MRWLERGAGERAKRGRQEKRGRGERGEGRRGGGANKSSKKPFGDKGACDFAPKSWENRTGGCGDYLYVARGCLRPQGRWPRSQSQPRSLYAKAPVRRPPARPAFLGRILKQIIPPPQSRASWRLRRPSPRPRRSPWPRFGFATRRIASHRQPCRRTDERAAASDLPGARLSWVVAAVVVWLCAAVAAMHTCPVWTVYGVRHANARLPVCAAAPRTPASCAVQPSPASQPASEPAAIPFVWDALVEL